jgi:hypothetical protein
MFLITRRPGRDWSKDLPSALALGFTDATSNSGLGAADVGWPMATGAKETITSVTFAMTLEFFGIAIAERERRILIN